MRSHPLTALPLAIASFALAACSTETELTASGDAVADFVARVLEEQLGERPEVDCGDFEVIVSSGKEVDCTVIDPVTGAAFEVTATLHVIGADEGWRVRVEVPDESDAERPTEPADGSDVEGTPTTGPGETPRDD
ncbi:hypothetical protein [Glycomyces sp. YM15]|uniref:hypothetical protein n=1 Tax=Glycomyces sp. YM15 TaxID=2800446 RepID=UPI00196374B5|nr:hypothetical protein [Glycomyces sp. YM15]